MPIAQRSCRHGQDQFKQISTEITKRQERTQQGAVNFMGISDLSTAVAKDLGITAAQGRMAVDAVIGQIQASLINKEDVTLRGFGSFKVKATKARVGHNPATGETLQIPAGEKISFKASK